MISAVNFSIIRQLTCNRHMQVNLFPTYGTSSCMKLTPVDVFRCKLMDFTGYVCLCIILKWVVSEQGVRAWTVLEWLRIGFVL